MYGSWVRASALPKSAWWCTPVTVRSRKQGFKFKACLSSEIKRGVRSVVEPFPNRQRFDHEHPEVCVGGEAVLDILR